MQAAPALVAPVRHRVRQEQLLPLRTAAPPSPFWARPQDPITVGRIVVDGILHNDLFIFPAPEYRQGVMARAYAMIDSMVPFVPFPPNVEAGIASNSYLFTPMYIQEVAHRRANAQARHPGHLKSCKSREPVAGSLGLRSPVTCWRPGFPQAWQEQRADETVCSTEGGRSCAERRFTSSPAAASSLHCRC